MKNLITSLLTAILLSIPAFTQPNTLWTKTFGGILENCGYSVQQTSDGGYIIAGYIGPQIGLRDVYLIKTNSNGDTIWTRTFGGPYDDWGWCVQQTIDGGYIIVGFTDSYSVSSYGDVYLIKTNMDGDTIWTRTFGGSSTEFGFSVQQTSDSGYIIAGWTNSYGSGNADVYLIKTDDFGIEQWSKTFGGSGGDLGLCVQQTGDGGYIIAGYTGSYGAGSADVYLIKTDEYGNESWSQTFGGNDSDWGWCVQQTTDGGYIITGHTYSYGAGLSDSYLIKTDSSGNQQWSQTFGGSSWDNGSSVQQTIDGGYIIAGSTSSYGAGSSNVYLIKTDSSGNQQWSQTFGGSSTDGGLSVQQTSDGGYIISGWTSYSCDWIVVYLIRLESELSVEDLCEPCRPYQFALHKAYPNPFNPETNLTFDLPHAGEISLIIYDIAGREIVRLIDGFQPAGTHETTFDASNLPSGIYFARLTASSFHQTRKLLLIK